MSDAGIVFAVGSFSSSNARVFSVFLSLCFLYGCGAGKAKPSVIVPQVVIPVVQAPPRQLSVTEKLLVQAEALFDQGKLLMPEEDNAYIRYRAIQLMEPDNLQAKAGLDAILLNEVDVARSALARSQLRSAQTRLVMLKRMFPGAEMLNSLEVDINTMRAALQPKRVVEKNITKKPSDRIYLDKRALSAKSEEAIRQLQGIAVSLVDANESVLIYARTDSEGRWIYQQMRDAVPEYRVRGNIAIGEPAIRKLAPLE